MGSDKMRVHRVSDKMDKGGFNVEGLGGRTQGKEKVMLGWRHKMRIQRRWGWGHGESEAQRKG